MLRFTVRSILRVIQHTNNTLSLNAVSSRSHSRSGIEMERSRNRSSVESELTRHSNCIVKSDMSITSNNSCVDVQIIPSHSVYVESKPLIQKRSNENLEKDITCSHSRVESEEIMTNLCHSEQNVVKPCSSLISSPFNTDFSENIASNNLESQNDSHLKFKVMTTEICAPDETKIFILNNDCHAECVETTYQNNSDVQSKNNIKTYCHSLIKPYEVQTLSLAHAELSSKSHEESGIITRCRSLTDSVELIPSTLFRIESDNVTNQSLSCTKSETMVPDNMFRMLSDKEDNNVISEDMRDSVSYTDSEMVIPDLEFKIEDDTQSNKDDSRGIRIISEEMLDSVAFADSEMIIPNERFKDESMVCCFSVETKAMPRRNDFHAVPITISFSNMVSYSSPEIYKDNNTKPSSGQINEECEVMDEFLNNMKEYVQYLTQEDFLEMLKIKEFGPYVNPYTGELGGPKGPEPTRYGDWEIWGKCVDF